MSEEKGIFNGEFKIAEDIDLGDFKALLDCLDSANPPITTYAFFENKQLFPHSLIDNILSPGLQKQATVTFLPNNSKGFFKEGDLVHSKTVKHLLGNPVVKAKLMVAKMRRKTFVPTYKVTSCSGNPYSFSTTLTPHNF
jgi:hypothetical protein